MQNWTTYFKKHASRKPREQLVRAVSFCTNKVSALDLGAGTLIESMFLLEAGFEHVTAVDSSPQSVEFAKQLDQERFVLETKTFNQFQFPNSEYDLVNAQFALPFYGEQNFDLFIETITKSLKVGGIFVGQFFGVNDGWNTPDRNMAFQTKEEALELLKSFEILEFIEEDKEGSTAAGESKHWHIFHFISRKNKRVGETEELMKKSGRYEELYNIQAKRYKDDQ